MGKIAFVVLHYMTEKSTIESVDSILNHINEVEYKIIIVDNGSINNSYEKIKAYYNMNRKIEIIRTGINLGFAKGNNKGYEYAKNIYRADFIVISNNDVIFKQEEFITKCIQIYNNTNYHILGPDIVNLDGIHQNPIRETIISEKKVNRLLINSSIMLVYLYIKKIMHLDSKVQILEKMFERKNIHRRNTIIYDKYQENIVLQGSCYVFSPIYISQNKMAFYPDTFMFGEEDILAYLNSLCGNKIIYSPEISVIHKEQCSRNATELKSIDRKLFFYKNNITSMKILYKLMNNTINLKSSDITKTGDNSDA